MNALSLYLFKKYWGKHKGRMFSLILSIVLLTGTAVFSVLNERTELRRQLHESFDIFGNYAVAVRNVTEDQAEQIAALPYIDRIGIVSSIGTISVGNNEYTAGCFENDEGVNSCHLPLDDGKLPEKSGQIAIPKFILNELYGSAEVGDKITLKFIDLNNNESEIEFELSGIIGNYTSRFDKEYIGSRDGITVTGLETECPAPSIYLYNGDTAHLKKYYNYFISPSEESYFSEEGIENFNKTCEMLWDITDRISSGQYGYIMLSMAGADDFQGGLQAETSDNIKIINIITLLMLIVAAISMISGVISIMPQRIESLQLLRLIGMSKRKLTGIFITEFLLFWIIGNILGISAGCGLHEIVIVLQKMLGISAYRGYFTELIISEKTASPFIMPLILSFILAVLSLIVPMKSIAQMSTDKKRRHGKLSASTKNLRRAFSKITGTHFLSLLSCVSIITVICTTVFGYCYYTESGKGTTYFGIGKEKASAAYYKVNGIDIKENGIDSIITMNIPNTGGFSVYDKEYGISDSELKALSSSAETFAYGRYSAYNVVYNDDEEIPKQLADRAVPLNEGWEYYDEFKGNTLYDVPILLINENIMKFFGAEEDDIIALSQNYNFAFEAGDTVPIIICLCDDNAHILPDTIKKIDVEITKQINVSETGISENGILCDCGLFNSFEYAVAMTAGTAERLGFYYPDYSTVTIDFYQELNDEEMRNYILSSVTKPVRAVTIFELESNAKINALSSNANTIVLFILLFVLCLISMWNLMQMNVQNNKEKFSIIHSIGMPVKKIKGMFVGSTMKFTVAAVLIGIVLSISGKWILRGKYDEYYSLLQNQQEMAGNEDFPDVISAFSLSYLDVSDPLYEITEKMEKLQDRFWLDKEMWLPHLTLPLLIICGVIILSIFLCSLSAAKKIKDERIRNDD